MQKHSLITQTKKPTFRLLKSIQDHFYTSTQKNNIHLEISCQVRLWWNPIFQFSNYIKWACN